MSVRYRIDSLAWPCFRVWLYAGSSCVPTKSQKHVLSIYLFMKTMLIAEIMRLCAVGADKARAQCLAYTAPLFQFVDKALVCVYGDTVW